MAPPKMAVSRGSPLLLGVHARNGGFNFSLFSRHAERVELLLFEPPMAVRPSATIDLDATRHRTGDIWHVHVAGVNSAYAYAYRVHGPWDPAVGHRFDARRMLLDPYARAIAGTANWNFASLAEPRQPTAEASAQPDFSPRCVAGQSEFDWQDDLPPRRRWSETVIYETHVRGLTIHPSSAVAGPGTFAGLIEKIPYLRALGVTALELMPVHEFNEREIARHDPTTGLPLRNYWGYSTAAFFAPKEGYGSATPPGGQLDEFKAMVKALHAAGIEVILDVVFNHTAEGDERGPTLSFRGLDNVVYYLLQADRRFYRDLSGCGNTLNCNHAVVHHFVIDCLRYWVAEMRVDGFRFDLASVLGRDEQGRLLANPALLEHIAEDPILRGVKLIAEAWDAAGAFQVGSFPGQRWAEWNSRFRDDVRRFWRGDAGMTGALATRVCGSADLYQRSGKTPVNSVNFVTCHDGFTLNDLVSYAHKHNEANAEGGRDGVAENYSDNHGVEGVSDDPAIEALRLRQIKNLLTTLFVSRGVPMLLGGDEFRRTQGGNNNAYCQDNETSWFDWRLAQRHADLVRFVRRLLALRRAHPVLRAERFYRADEIAWFGRDGRTPAWDGPDNLLGCLIREDADRGLCLLFNATREACTFTLPAPARGGWRISVDTSTAAPADAPDDSLPLTAHELVVSARSAMVLIAGPE